MFKRPEAPLGSYSPSSRFARGNFDRGLSNYQANNSTAMAAPLELSPEDIARLDNDITTQGFREDAIYPASTYAPNYDYNAEMYHDKENRNYYQQARNDNYHPRQPTHDFRNAEEVGRFVADLGVPPSSEPYYDNSPLQLRRSTSDAARNKVITPPTSSPNLDKPPQNFRRPLAPLNYEPRQNYQETQQRHFEANLGKQSNGALVEMQNMYEDKIDQIKRAEQERVEALETEYKQRIAKLQKDMNMIVEKQDHVMKLRGEVDCEVEKDLERVQAELKQECHHRRSEREKYEGRVKELQRRVEELQKKLKKYSPGFGDGSSTSTTIRSYEAKISQMQQEHDQKIANLIKQFDREKQSALDIMKTRIKSEINLLVPKIRQQCQAAFNQALLRCQEETAKKYRDKYGTVIRKLKEEHQAEKRFIQKQAKETAELEKVDWKKAVKAKYEMRAMEVKNECERRLLERMRKPSNVSFVVSDSFTDASSSFYNTDGVSFL